MAPESWRKNLITLFIAEFVAMTGFAFVGPYMPLFIQQLGGYTPEQAAFWTGMSSSGVGLGMLISSPLWGIAADRWGRKPMVLRVMFAGGVVMALQGIAPNIYWFIALKWAQGILTGSAAAVTAMATSVVPREKIPYAAGLITVAVSGGSSLGPMIGGFLADHIGYTKPFFVIGGMLFAAGILVLFLAREQFEAPPRQQASLKGMLRLAVSRDMVPIMIFLFALSFSGSLAGPIIPLFIKELNPAGQAATAAGLTFGITGGVYTLSSLVAARLSTCVNLRTLLIFSCLAGFLSWLPPIWATSVTQLFIFLVMGSIPGGGVGASSNALVGLAVAQGQQGMAYGLANSAGALGWGLGPLVGGWLASIWGFRPLFALSAGLGVALVIFIIKFLPRRLFPDIRRSA
ncbi:MAG: MFS transporter [Chloroflexi bacterium]|nr:MFS transporter [Chloroflexota bacterium]